MNIIDKIIFELFSENWSGEPIKSSLDDMKKQLYKNLKDQIKGYWSGHTAYFIMVNGGFLIDAKSSTKKKLTKLGEIFIEEYEEQKYGK